MGVGESGNEESVKLPAGLHTLCCLAVFYVVLCAEVVHSHYKHT